MNQKNQFHKVENRGRIGSGVTARVSTQSGRSMVEMLGVLAVIGVLSVGGIVGYKKAITSHRANETISRLMRRAVVIAGQVGLGQTADLSGFNPSDGTYKIPNTLDTTTTAGKFALTVEDVPPEVCQKITDMWTLPAIQPGPCGSETADMTFTFNNDLTDFGTAEDYTEKTSCRAHSFNWCADDTCKENCCIGISLAVCQSCDPTSGTPRTTADGSGCTTGQGGAGVCINGSCKASTCEENETYCGGECCPSNAMCTTSGDTLTTSAQYKAVCVQKTDQECLTNADCADPTKYCVVTANYKSSTTVPGCFENFTGHCETIESGKNTTYPNLINTSLGQVLRSKNMSWWSARNWCEAQGMHLLPNEVYMQSYRTELLGIFSQEKGYIWKSTSSGQTGSCKGQNVSLATGNESAYERNKSDKNGALCGF